VSMKRYYWTKHITTPQTPTTDPVPTIRARAGWRVSVSETAETAVLREARRLIRRGVSGAATVYAVPGVVFGVQRVPPWRGTVPCMVHRMDLQIGRRA